MEKQKTKKPKKPYQIKRSELNLDEYRQEINDRSPGHLFQRGVIALRTSRQFHLYLVLQILSIAFGYGQIMFCIGLLWSFYVNTGKRKEGEKSAYSIFNENAEAIDGATNMEYLDREMRRQLY